MSKEELFRLARAIENEGGVTDKDMAGLFDVISHAFPDRRPAFDTSAAVLSSTDVLLDLISAALPSWSLHLSGASAVAHGRWSCTVRETGVRDDDEVIGVGKAGTPPRAIAAALLNVMALREERS